MLVLADGEDAIALHGGEHGIVNKAHHRAHRVRVLFLGKLPAIHSVAEVQGRPCLSNRTLLPLITAQSSYDLSQVDAALSGSVYLVIIFAKYVPQRHVCPLTC